MRALEVQRMNYVWLLEPCSETEYGKSRQTEYTGGKNFGNAIHTLASWTIQESVPHSLFQKKKNYWVENILLTKSIKRIFNKQMFLKLWRQIVLWGRRGMALGLARANQQNSKRSKPYCKSEEDSLLKWAIWFQPQRDVISKRLYWARHWSVWG